MIFFYSFFPPDFYGQRSVTDAWATRSPWSILIDFFLHIPSISFLGLPGVGEKHWAEKREKKIESQHTSCPDQFNLYAAFLVQAFLLTIVNTDFFFFIAFHPLWGYPGSWFIMGPHILT